MWCAILCSLALAAAPEVDDDAVAALTRPLAAGFARPDPDAVREYWSRSGPEASVVQVVHGTVRRGKAEHEAVFRLENGVPHLIFGPTEEAEAEAREWLREVELERSGGVWTGGKVVVEPRWTSGEVAIDRALWASWTYVGVLAEFQGPLYAEVPPAAEAVGNRLGKQLLRALSDGEEGAIRQALDAVLASPWSSDDRRWSDALTAARGLGDLELQRQIYRHFRPWGRCSMDTYPEQLAGEYAVVCHELGRTSCAVNLQIRSMDYWGFDRVAWSSYGEAASETGVDRLATMGLDMPTFLLGLALEFDGVEDQGISLQRLGRAVHESAERDAVVEAFEGVARSAHADEYNRLLATIVLHNAHIYAGTELPLEGLSRSGRAWVKRSSR